MQMLSRSKVMTQGGILCWLYFSMKWTMTLKISAANVIFGLDTNFLIDEIVGS